MSIFYKINEGILILCATEGYTLIFDIYQKYDVRFVFSSRVVCREFMSYLRYLCLFTYSGVQHILWCILFCFSSLYPMLSVSLDCPLLITPSVFSDVYLQQDNNVVIYIHGIYFDSIRYHNSNVPTPILLICTFFAGANSIISFSFASNNKTWH